MKKIIYLVLVIAIGSIVFAGCSKPVNPPKTDGTGSRTENGTEDVIDQTDLLYSSTSWAGLCGKDGKDGGCAWETYLYTTGKVLDVSVFQEWEGKKDETRNEKQLTPEQVDAVIKKIKDSGIMDKKCEMGTIMDAGWDYKIILDGKEKTFRNPPDDCNKIFNELDKLIGS